MLVTTKQFTHLPQRPGYEGAKVSGDADTFEVKACEASPRSEDTGTWAESHSIEYKSATRWLTNILNMAGPASFASGTFLTSPDMALSLRSPRGAQLRQEQPISYEASSIALTAEGRARAIVNELGNGEELSLSEALEALVVANPGKQENCRSLVESYFSEVDADGSGSLSTVELIELLNYYDEETSKGLSGRILLPNNRD